MKNTFDLEMYEKRQSNQEKKYLRTQRIQTMLNMYLYRK